MKPIDLNLDPTAVVKGAIYDSMDPRFLREELLEISLPSGLTIAVGWEPHCDPSGAFRLVLFAEYITNVRRKARTKSLSKALAIVRQWAEQYLHSYSDASAS
jgi:hypothetical protein